MAKNKLALIRYMTIDRCLQNNRRKWTWRDLQKACYEKLLDEGIESMPSKSTIDKDIKCLKDGSVYEIPAPIECVQEGKNKIGYYRYTDSEFSLLPYMKLPAREVATLRKGIDLIKQVAGFHFLDDIEALVQKLEKKVTQKTTAKNFIEFDTVPDATGIKYLDRIYRAIASKEALDMQYQPFTKKDPSKITLHSYLLKEYNNRWFVVGLSFYKDYPPSENVFGLERIQSIKKSTRDFIPNSSFVPSEFFKYALGVTVPKDLELQEIILSFTSARGQYVKTKPIHWSQKILADNTEEVRISLQLIINRELVREVLSFREDVRVIAPAGLQNEIRGIAQKVQAYY